MHILFLPMQEPIIEVEVRVDCSAVSLEYTPMPMIVIRKQKNYVFPWQVSVCKCLAINVLIKISLIFRLEVSWNSITSKISTEFL